MDTPLLFCQLAGIGTQSCQFRFPHGEVGSVSPISALHSPCERMKQYKVPDSHTIYSVIIQHIKLNEK